MFVSIVRTSVSIFRSIRPLKPILFDFHFSGHQPLQILKDLPWADHTKRPENKKSIFFKKQQTDHHKTLQTCLYPWCELLYQFSDQSDHVNQFYKIFIFLATDHCKSLRVYLRLAIPNDLKTKNQFFSKNSKPTGTKLIKHVCIHGTNFFINFQINQTIKTNFIRFLFFWPPTTANP